MPRGSGLKKGDDNPYREAELAVVRDVQLSLQEVADKLGRPYGGVKKKAAELGIKRRRGAWQPWEVEILENVTIPLTEVSRLVGRKLGSVYAEASARKIVGRVPGRPRDPDRLPKVRGETFGPRKPKRTSREAVRLLVETSLSYSEISDLTGVDRTSLRKMAHYRGVANRGQLKGEQAHKWRGGKKQRLQAAGSAWEAIRLGVLERDGYTCQDCGFVDLSGSRLHVHHVIPWRLRRVSDPDWLVTLCLACHGKRPEHYWEEIPEDVLALLAGRLAGGVLPV